MNSCVQVDFFCVVTPYGVVVGYQHSIGSCFREDGGNMNL